ncbi:PREDICTED: epsin-1-like, partial [Bison bison bison]|uniref:Epsin-1-like n=1 Tax=Bison bison bison TaxID=43346 RepID=A0A6P3I792_BISBB
MSTSSLRRQVKNIVHNYSEAEIKVREATSNDPWGPSSSLMSEIADLTYNVVAFSEIMSMIWKRLNDHGKNWRHVYKAMTLMEYLIKTGSERVSQQCKENMYAVQTLKDFQYVDRDGKDQGVNVREKARQLVALLRDEDRLREERAHALKTKEKLAQTATASSAAVGSGPPPEAEQAWPQSSGEEELQLQLALAMSKEEADQVPVRCCGVAGAGLSPLCFHLHASPPPLQLSLSTLLLSGGLAPPQLVSAVLHQVGALTLCLVLGLARLSSLLLCVHVQALSPPPRPRLPPDPAPHTSRPRPSHGFRGSASSLTPPP